MKWGLVVLLFILPMSVMAVSNPVNYNSKTYYKVVSTDPTEDTGDEVCAKLGQVCMGFTETSSAVCKLYHPQASDSSGFSGDSSGVYCNGAPQGGVCAGLTDTCSTCTSCTASVQCNQPIGGLYREMYVECGSGQCSIKVGAANTVDLIAQIAGINSQLKACPVSIPKGAGSLIKNGDTQIIINMNSGAQQNLILTAAGGKLMGIRTGTGSCVQKLTLSENTLDTILQSSDPVSTALWMLGQKQISVSGCTIASSIRLFFVNPIARFTVKKAVPAQPAPKPAPNCGQVGEQCNNRACFSGMCGAPKEQNSNGQWGFWNYRCIDQKTYTANCIGRGNTPPAWTCLIGVCR